MHLTAWMHSQSASSLLPRLRECCQFEGTWLLQRRATASLFDDVIAPHTKLYQRIVLFHGELELPPLSRYREVQLGTVLPRARSRRSGGRSSAGVKAAVPGSGLPQKGGVAPAAVDIRGEASVDLGIGSQLAKAVGERRDGPEAARRTFNGKTMAQIQEERRNRAKQGAPAIAAPAAATRFRPSSGWSGRRTQSAVQSSGGGAISTGSFPSLGGLADKQQARVSALELAGQQQAASGRWALQTLDDESDEDDPEEETVALLGSEEVLPPVDAAPQSPAQFAAAVAKALDVSMLPRVARVSLLSTARTRPLLLSACGFVFNLSHDLSVLGGFHPR